MGIIYSIYRKKPRGRFELGKPKIGRSSEVDLPKQPSAAPLSKEWWDWQGKLDRWMHPNNYLIWSIMTSEGDYTVFTLSSDDLERVTDAMMGCASITSKEQARLAADHLIKWAKGSELILIPDTDSESEILREHGFPTGHRHTGDIWEVL